MYKVCAEVMTKLQQNLVISDIIAKLKLSLLCIILGGMWKCDNDPES